VRYFVPVGCLYTDVTFIRKQCFIVTFNLADNLKGSSKKSTQYVLRIKTSF